MPLHSCGVHNAKGCGALSPETLHIFQFMENNGEVHWDACAGVVGHRQLIGIWYAGRDAAEWVM